MEGVFLYFTGCAGSGKSTLTQSFKVWMDKMGYNATTINLDPGVERIPYPADIDVRDWFTLSDIMEEYGLGPNGAQIVAADMIALRAGEIRELVNEMESDYCLVDTPGQMELFTFRECSKIIIKTLNEEKSVIVFLFDPMLSTTPSNFVSQILLGSTTQFRFYIPTINVLSKIDLLEEEQLEQILNWSKNPDALYDALVIETPDMKGELSVELFRAFENLGTYKELIPISSEEMTGLEDLYSMVQQIFAGGEDLASD
ncbi:MAG: ATP/GTP-binding protein [Thermoplasmata archaeon]|nr:MAG: ATP/GTP-binding protein [Thermoplasmata archaeon]